MENMRHRIFIAINLPEKIKKKLVSYQANWPELPIRWVKRENLHVTLVFLGYVLDEEIPEILETTREVAKRHEPFSINLNKICYGPPRKMPPRMVWAAGGKSEEFGKIQEELESLFLRPSPKDTLKLKKRQGSPHITLGRIRKWEFKQIEPEERPQIEGAISLSFPVNSIDIMEAFLKRTGAEYTVLESIPLGT